MAVNTENIRRWIEQSEIDYISQYIKAWIPFNAWYNAEYDDLNLDRQKINAIKNKPNVVRNKFNSLMELTGQENQEFTSYLASLHNELQSVQIDSKDGRIWFNDIVKEKNPHSQINETRNRIDYYIKREDKDRIGEVRKVKFHLTNNTRATVWSYEHTSYDLEHLQSNTGYQELSIRQKENIRLLFEQINPVLIHDVIQHSICDEPKNYYYCDSINFVRDTTNSYHPSHIMCKCLIETLYKLRNVLFHGELTPNAQSQKVYKNAYFCLKYLLEALK